jgi:hypothetical protein
MQTGEEEIKTEDTKKLYSKPPQPEQQQPTPGKETPWLANIATVKR